MNQPRTSLRAWIVAVSVIAGASFCALIPWFHYGIPSGHDFEFHFNSWVEVLDHWRQGVVYPHWAAWAHYGYGEARFIFYPPGSWTLGGVLSAILPWKMVPGAFVWLALTLAGLSMFAAAKNWVSPGSALFAAIFYALNPYHLVIVYWRSAFAELLAAAYLPLLMFCVVRLEERRQRMIAPIALLLAAGWLTNIPSAVMMHYMLGVLAIGLTVFTRRWSVLLYAGIAVIAGAALAAVYLLPVWHQRTWVSLDQVLSPGVRPQENFLFAHTTDAEHDKFNHLVSLPAICEFAVLAASLLLWRVKSTIRLRRIMLVLGGFSAAIMLAFTSSLWNYLPELRYVQFPWRWLLVLNMVLVLTVVFAFQKWWARSVVCLLLLAPVLMGAQRILAPWWDHTGDLWEMVDNQHDQIGNEGVDEYAPTGADPYDVDQNAPLVKYDGGGSAKISIERWDAEHRVITAQATAPGVLVLKLFNYPRWEATVNGREEYTGITKQHQLTVPTQSGRNRIELRFVGGWDRRIGAAISLATLLALALWYKKRSRPSMIPVMAGA
jgi:hypothetical protein